LKSRPAIFASAFVIGLSGAMMPGPLLGASVAYAAKEGFLAGGPLLVLGHAILELALLVLVLVGLGPLLSRRPVAAAIGVVGGAVLLWMGCGMVGAAWKGIEFSADAKTTMLLANPVVAGILVSLSNPYWSLWWATIGLKYIALSRERGATGVAAFYLGHQLSDAAWYFFVAGAVALGRKVVSATVYSWVIGVCGLVLLGFGFYFLGTGGLWLVRRARGSEASEKGEVR